MNTDTKIKLLPYALGVLQIFVGITAVMGGFGLVSDPSGTSMGVPLMLLDNSPFKDYFIPGLVLLVIIGIGNVVAGAASFLRKRYAGNLAVFFGAFLTAYIAIEVWFIGLQNFSQPSYFIFGLIEFALGLKLSRSTKTLQQIWIEPAGSKLAT